MFLQNLLFSRKTAPAPQPEIEPAAERIVREDFTLDSSDTVSISSILDALRRDTIEFTEEHRLAWAVTDFNILGTPVRVKLTEDQDVVYIVNGETTFNAKAAQDLIRAQVQF